MEFPFDQATTFQDLETGEVLPVAPDKLAERYRKLVSDHVDAIGQVLRAHRIDHVLVNIGEPLDQALFTYLTFRERATKVR